jgi:hypothetical protein
MTVWLYDYTTVRLYYCTTSCMGACCVSNQAVMYIWLCVVWGDVVGNKIWRLYCMSRNVRWSDFLLCVSWGWCCCVYSRCEVWDVCLFVCCVCVCGVLRGAKFATPGPKIMLLRSISRFTSDHAGVAMLRSSMGNMTTWAHAATQPGKYEFNQEVANFIGTKRCTKIITRKEMFFSKWLNYTAPLYYCAAVLLYCCTTLHHCTPLYYCTTAVLYHCTSVLLYYCTVLL